MERAEQKTKTDERIIKEEASLSSGNSAQKNPSKLISPTQLQHLIKGAIEFFYNSGHLTKIREYAAPDIVTFGTISLRYYVGMEEMELCLRRELRHIMPCKLLKVRTQIADDIEEPDRVTAFATAVVRTSEGVAPIIHRMVLMFVKDAASPIGLFLKGIHVTRDLHHESTYRMMQARSLTYSNDGSEKDGEEKIDRTNVLDTYADCAYITYRKENGRILVSASNEFYRILGYSGKKAFWDETQGQFSFLVSEADKKRIANETAKQLMQRDMFQLEYPIKTNDGRNIWILECGSREMDDSGRIVYKSVVININALKNVGRDIMHRMSFDELTGIYNKGAFSQKAHDMIASHPDREYELMRFDVNRFKVINELYGEATGDGVLKYIADFLKRINMPECVYGRLHSDHFLVCYSNDDYNREQLVEALRTLVLNYKLDYRVELSFGIYKVVNRHTQVFKMIDRAGLALTKAKQDSFSPVREYDEEMRRDIVTEQTITNELAGALLKREFIVYLQPKYALATETLCGAEALVRWKHPERGMVSPGVFIPVFEHNGLIFELDYYIWEETCRLQRMWIDKGFPAYPISINVSRIDLYREDLCEKIHGLIQKYDIPMDLIGLEITESAYTDNPQQIIDVTKKLQSLGFKILMDDFGSGYSSLNMLKDMPVDVLKIDLKFLENTGDDHGRGTNILNSIVRMAKWLNMHVVAEGAETRQQVEFLRSVGCDEVQGYYFSRPVPVDEFEVLLRASDGDDMQKKIEAMLRWMPSEDADKLMNWDSHAMALLNTVNEGISLYEMRGDTIDLVRANNGYYQIFDEFPSDSATETGSILEKVHEDDRAGFLEAISNAKESGSVTECHIKRYRGDGSLAHVNIKVRVVGSGTGRDFLYLAIEDVSTEIAKEKELNDFLVNIPGGFGCYHSDGKSLEIIYLSRWLHALNGMTEETCKLLTGDKLVKIVGQEVEEHLISMFKESMEKQHPISIEYPFTSIEGKSYWLLASLMAVAEPDGCFTGYAIISDITDRHGYKTEESEERIIH